MRYPAGVEAGPYCRIGTGDHHQIVHPADFASQLNQLWTASDATWWMRTAAALERAARSGTGRLNGDLCAELARAIRGGLQGILPMAFAASAGLDAATGGRAELSRRVQAEAYMLAWSYGYMVDRDSVKTLLEALKIDRRTWHRWKENQDRDRAEDLLYLSLCEGGLYQEIGRPWARLAVLVALRLADEQQARELHLARGGRISVDKDGQEVFVWGDDPLDAEP